MPSINETNPYVTRFTDAILSNSALRDNLEDSDAQLLINWGLEQAKQTGATVQDEEDAENKLRSLNRLIKYVGRYTARRYDKDAGWAQDIIDRLNEYSQGIGGRAPTEEERAELLAHQTYSNAALLEKLFASYGLPLEKKNDSLPEEEQD